MNMTIVKANAVLLCLLMALLISCKETKIISKVSLSVLTNESGLSTYVRINTYDLVSFEEIPLSEGKVDSTLKVNISLDIQQPVMAYYEVAGKFGPLYLEPGYELVLNFKKDRIQFEGVGAAVNNYLARATYLHNTIANANNKPYYTVSTQEFLDRLDSITKALSSFHKYYTDSVKLPEGTIHLLDARNKLNSYALLNYYSTGKQIDLRNDLSERALSNVASEEILYDTTFLINHIVEYAGAINMYLDHEFYRKFYLNKNPEEIQATKELFPGIANKEINDRKYHAMIKEFLLSKNISYWMRSLGLTPSVDSIFDQFKHNYPSSTHLSALKRQYEEWLAISPGTSAPDFSGLTLDGKTLSLKDLKGKVVYIDVWATWCAPCIKEIPFAKKLQGRFEGNNQVQFVNISIDRDKEAWKHFVLSDKSWRGLHLHLEEKEKDMFWKNYKMFGVPTYILIDQTGRIINAKALRPSEGGIELQLRNLVSKGV